MKKLFKSLVRDESGQDLIEYALLAGFISLVAVTIDYQPGIGCERCVRQPQLPGQRNPVGSRISRRVSSQGGGGETPGGVFNGRTGHSQRPQPPSPCALGVPSRFKIGRDDWIRTSDPLTPSQVRYQTAPHPADG